MNTFALFNLPEGLLQIGVLVAGFFALILGWIIHPWTVGGLTRWVESPMQQFFARVGTAVGAAALTVVFGFQMLEKDKVSSSGTSSTSSSSSDDPFANPRVATPTSSITPNSSLPNPFAEPQPTPPAAQRPPAQAATSIEQPAVVSPSPQSAPPSPSTTTTTPEIAESPKDEAPETHDDRGSTPAADSTHMRIAELKGELAALDAKIQSERQRWQEGVNVINRLTNFKRTPVREGSPQYHQCMAASRVIQEVEAGAPGLKAEKARLEAMIQSLEGK